MPRFNQDFGHLVLDGPLCHFAELGTLRGVARRYLNPPLVEAICEFRFEPSAPWDPVHVAAVQERLPEYRERRGVRGIEASLALGPDDFSQSLRPIDLTQLLAPQGAILQIGPGLLTVNHVPPYPGWDEWLPKVRDALDAYQQVFAPSAILRTAVVYLNHIELPGPRLELDDWFEIRPHLGAALPQDHGDFLLGIEFVLGEDGEHDRARVEFSAAPAEQEGHLGFNLVVRAEPLGVQPAPERVLFLLDRSHAHVEQVFEGCLTPRLREHFKEIPHQ